jgi:hypothetical protein
MASRWRQFGPLTGTAFALCFASAAAHAEPALSASPPAAPAPQEATAFCAKTRARAEADAALLIAPTVKADAIKLPPAIQRSARLDPTLGGAEYQGRASLVVSPLHMYKGFKVLDAAEAECAQQTEATHARDVATDAMEGARLAALRKQAAFLRGRRDSWEAISTKMHERFATRAVTLVDLEDVNAVTERLARQQIQLAGEIAKIQASGIGSARVDVTALRSRVVSTARAFEHKASHIRSLDAWDMSITAGVVPPVFEGNDTAVYGVVSLSYNFGGPWHTGAEGRYRDAREQELRAARVAALRQLDTVVAVARASRRQAEGEVEVIERRRVAVMKSKATVEESESASAFRQLAVFDLELLSLESESVYLKELATELSHMEGE